MKTLCLTARKSSNMPSTPAPRRLPHLLDAFQGRFPCGRMLQDPYALAHQAIGPWHPRATALRATLRSLTVRPSKRPGAPGRYRRSAPQAPQARWSTCWPRASAHAAPCGGAGRRSAPRPCGPGSCGDIPTAPGGGCAPPKHVLH